VYLESEENYIMNRTVTCPLLHNQIFGFKKYAGFDCCVSYVAICMKKKSAYTFLVRKAYAKGHNGVAWRRCKCNLEKTRCEFGF
jgi:hypothetical protein